MTGGALSEAETRVVSALLAQAWGPEAEIRGAAAIWNRSHVLRLHVAPDRSVVMKRRGEQGSEGRARSFGVELAALAYLNAMPAPVAPRLVAADARAGILLMEDLGPGPSLADALLVGDRERAQADLVSYAEALAAMHAWSMERPGELAGLRARYAPGAQLSPSWLEALAQSREEFLAAVAGLGLASGGASAEIEELPYLLNGPGYLGLVHGDACPDNMRFRAGGCRIFDFETSGWGPFVLDAAYLLAPFPSCWCFARLPAEVADPAIAAYRARVQAAGIELGAAWEAAMAAALATWIVARGPMITRVLQEDREWGTTTLRPRLLTWLGSLIGACRRAGVLPSLRALAEALHEELGRRWPQAAVPDYPALAGPGSARVQVPEWWQPEA
jgi:aminoglycoside phosphotransferase (APT) family kinase protein